MADPGFERPTAGDLVQFPSQLLGISETQTMQQRASNLASQIAFLREENAALGNDIAHTHHRSFRAQLDMRIGELSQQNPQELLTYLAEQGFGWRDVARMVGVSIPALRRWRQGDRLTGAHRRAVAQLASFVQVLIEDQLVFDPASWLEVPIVDEAPISGADFYAEGRLDLIYDLVTGHASPEAAMDEAYPDWRGRFRTDWKVEIAEDGLPSISQREDRWH